MSEPSPAHSTRRRRLLRAAAVLGGLLVAYTAFGFLAAPAIVRRVLVREASAALRREVTVAKVRVNPLALSVAVEGLAVRHRDGAPFLGWESLYVRLAPLRLLAGDVGLAEVRLVRPSVDVGLAADGALTFQDLLEGGAAAPAPGKARDEAEDGAVISIGRLSVEEARVAFHDATRRPAFDTTLGPLTVRLESFRTRGGRDSPYAFSGTTDAGETFRWTGTVRTQPFRSSGTLAFERIALPRYQPYLADQLPAAIASGLLDLETRYELEWGAERRVLRTAEGRAVVDDLALGPLGSAPGAVRLPRVEVSGIEADALARAAKVAEVAVRGGAVRVVREKDGALELARMAPPPSEAPWTWAVGAVRVSGLAVDVEDRTTARPVALPLTDVRVRLDRLSSDVASTWTLAASLVWAGRGRLAVEGSVEPFAPRGALDLEASDLDLVPFDPLVQAAVRARLAGARAGAKARVTFDASGKVPRWTLAGDARLEGLAVAEEGNDALLRWRALEVLGIDARSTPPRASARLVRLVEPRLRVYVWEDGSTSVARALGEPPPAPEPPAGAAAPEEAKPAAPPPPAAGPEWRTAIGAVQVVRGKAWLVDRSVTPAALVNVTGVEAKVTRLSSDPSVRSDVDVRVDVEGASPVRIAGTLNPLRKEAYADLTVTSEGVDLSPFDPYSGKFLGYGIQKGKLDLDLRYRVEDRTLLATNVVRVNQFTLGDRTDSPDATKLPVRLALALLQDRNGVILLDVPIEGRLDDPSFRLGKVIWRAVLNVLVKVATSPFAALAALAGGKDADLSLVEFAPGSADPLPEAQERIAMLARSLAERPALGLEVEGAAAEAQDGPALRREALELALRRARAATLRQAPASLEEVKLSAEERAKLVRAAFDAAFPPASRKPGEAPPSPADMEERLAAREQVPAEAYRTLAAQRAQRAREALIAAGLDQARLFLAQGGERAAKEQGARVYFTVR